MNYFGWYGFADGSREIYERYIEKLTRFAVYALDRGHNIRLLAGETTDAQAIADLTRRVWAERPAELRAAFDHRAGGLAAGHHASNVDDGYRCNDEIS